jgi:DNA uptake protein ComE-like DNA-binding protein
MFMLSSVKFFGIVGIVGFALAGFSLQAIAATEADKPVQKATTEKMKAPAQPSAPAPKLVDINGASSKDLQTQLGVSEEVASKIIAGRPYGSKSWLVSNNILDDGMYQSIKSRITTKLSKADIKAIASKQGNGK